MDNNFEEHRGWRHVKINSIRDTWKKRPCFVFCRYDVFIIRVEICQRGQLNATQGLTEDFNSLMESKFLQHVRLNLKWYHLWVLKLPQWNVFRDHLIVYPSDSICHIDKCMMCLFSAPHGLERECMFAYLWQETKCTNHSHGWWPKRAMETPYSAKVASKNERGGGDKNNNPAIWNTPSE